MVKKLLFLLTIFFIFNVSNVFAYQLPTAYTGVDYVDGTYQDGNTNIASWWGSNNYLASPFRIGYFTPATAEAEKVQFLWSNLNLCPNQNLKISGKIGALFNFFTENPYTISVFNNNQEMTCSFSLDESSRISYTCVGVGGGNFYLALTQLNFSSHNNYEVGVSRDVDYSCEVTNLQVMQQEIINTQNIINNQNSNTNTITQNQDDNTQDIIDNQNQNTQYIIDNQNETFGNICYTNLFDGLLEQGSFNTNTGALTSDQRRLRSINFIDVNNESYYFNLKNNSDFQLVVYVYDTNGNFKKNESITSWVDFPYVMSFDGQRKIKFGIRKKVNTNIEVNEVQEFVIFLDNQNVTNLPYVPYGQQTCINKLDEQISSINGVNDSITSESPPNTSQDIEDMEDMVASDTPISDLITMPLTLINAYMNGINTSCSSVNLGNLYGTDLVLPCINLEQRLGSNLWNIIDAFFSIFMCYNIGMLFVSAFDGLTSLRDDFEGLYQPRHADTGYQPKHGG